MAKNTSITSTSPINPRGLRGLRGKVAPVSMVLATKAVTLVTVLAAYYFIAFFAAVQVVPLVMGFVKAGTGVTLDMPVETVLSIWIVPALFLVALVFALVLATMKALWRLRTRIVTAVSRWALGTETGEAGKSAAAPFGSKSARKQKNTTTKAA